MSDPGKYLRERAANAGAAGARLLCSPDQLTAIEAQNLQRLHLFAISIVQETPERDPFVPSVLLEMHRICVDGIYPSAGRFRAMGEHVDVPGAGFQPAPVYRVEAEVTDLLASVRKVVDHPPRYHWRVNFAALALHRFLRIHPFLDGNGRVGRVFHQIVLYKLGVLEPPSIIYDFLLAHRDHYLMALRDADSGDFLPWFAMNRLAILDTGIQTFFDTLASYPELFEKVSRHLTSQESRMVSKDFRHALSFDDYSRITDQLIGKIAGIIEQARDDLSRE